MKKIATKGTVITHQDLMFLHSILKNVEITNEIDPDAKEILLCSREMLIRSFSQDEEAGKVRRLPYTFFIKHVKHLMQASLTDSETNRQEPLFPVTLYDIPSSRRAAIQINVDDIKIKSHFDEESSSYSLEFIDEK